MTELLGIAAAICTTGAFLPQAWKTIKSRDTSGISLWMYVIFTLGVFLWLAYGLAIRDLPIIAANAVTFALAATILAFKIRYK
jgi:MtN3 and saliva related transmembrane protein